MVPKTAEQKQAANKEASKAAPVLQLPELTALGATNGRHSSADKDDSGFDQDAADPLQAALGMLVNDEDDADDLQEFENLRSVLATVIKAKQDKSQKKKQALLQELQEAAAREVQALEAAVAKEHKQVMSSMTGSLNTAKKKLTDKFQAIEQLNAKYQQDMTAAWAEYSDLYNKFDETKRTTAAHLEKMRLVSHKRKLSELQASLQSKLAETDQKLTKLNSKAGKAQGLGGMLKQFMAAAE